MSLLQRLIDKYLTKLQRVPAALLLLIFFCTALVGSLYVCLPAALVLLVPCTCAYRRVADATAWSWFTLSAALLPSPRPAKARPDPGLDHRTHHLARTTEHWPLSGPWPWPLSLHLTADPSSEP